VKETTATGYVWLLNRYVVPRIGKKTLSKLTPLEVQRMLRDLEAEGYAPRTRRQVRSVLRRALADAERWGMVARNVAALVDAPSVDSSKLDDVLTPEEGQKVLAAVGDDRLQALAVLVMTTGMRKGEAMALRWVDVDLDEGTVRVAGTLKRAKGRWWIDTPKTAAGKRAIPVEGWVVESLREHRRHQAEERLALGPDWADHDFVFTTPIGTPLDGRNVTRWWHGVCASAGIERRRFHALRHSVATWLAEEGEPLEVIGERLGHSSHAVTVDIYLRVGERAKHQASTTLGRVLGL
jgi:integrase